MKKIAALLLSAALLLCAGCGGEEDPYVPTGNALSQGEVTEPVENTGQGEMILPYYPQRGLNPFTCSDYSNRGVFSLVYQSLFAVDKAYEPWPVLCKSYQVSWDMKTYTFQLADATFSDGSPVTVGDAVASLQAAKDSGVYEGRLGYVDQISVTEDDQLQITLTTPYENLPLLLDIPIVKASQVAEETPLGTGPFAFEKRGDGMGLRRSAAWWCSVELPITAQRITLMEAETPALLRDSFEFSNLTLVTADPGSDSYADFHSDYELWDSENGIFLYLACNDESPVFSIPAIRKALTYCVDREGIAQEYYRSFCYTTALPASPQSPYYQDSLADVKFDSQRMTMALVEHPEAKNMTVTLLVSSSDSVRVRVARSIAEKLTQSGLKVVVSEQSGDAYRTALEEGTFDLHLGQTKLSANMDLSAFFEPDGALAYGGLEDPVLYALCLESLANIGNYYTLHQRILDDGQLCPILFRSYAIFTQRGSFPELTPSRDNLFFYHLGITNEEARVAE